MRPKPKIHWDIEPLTPAEVSALLASCSRRAPTGIRNRALITLLYRSGLRISGGIGAEARERRPGAPLRPRPAWQGRQGHRPAAAPERR